MTKQVRAARCCARAGHTREGWGVLSCKARAGLVRGWVRKLNDCAKALMDSLLFVWGRKFGAQLQPQTGALVSERLWNQAIEIPI